jgi:CTP synthase (UTP-ammonia lyase)
MSTAKAQESVAQITIGLVGNYRESVIAHQAIPVALQLAAEANDMIVDYEWVPTEEIIGIGRISQFDGLWCVPNSPYRSMAGALLAIRYARENQIPLLGTCGGFQHAVIEYARNVLMWADADHAETAPDASRAVISPLECVLVEATDSVRLFPGSRIATAYGAEKTTEGYHCRYGLNPAFLAELTAGPLHITAEDQSGEVRAVELDNHPFFAATLFQPERAALKGMVPPIVSAFVKACRARR